MASYMASLGHNEFTAMEYTGSIVIESKIQL